MNKWYCAIVAIILGLATIQTTYGIIYFQPFRQGFLDLALLKSLLLFIICFVEAATIQKNSLRVIGLLLPILLLVGVLFRIMHWPWGDALIIVGFTSILINLVESALREKNKNLLNYLLFAFIADRFMVIILPPNETVWMIDYVLCFIIFLVSCIFLLRHNFSRHH
jgi:hypothetical protein